MFSFFCNLINFSPSYLFLGGSYEVGAFKNCFGGPSFFIRREAIDRLGGFIESDDAGYEDWEFYSNAALNTLKVDVVAQSLYKYRLSTLSLFNTEGYMRNAEASRQRSLRPYTDSLPLSLRQRLLNQLMTFDMETKEFKPKSLSSESTSIFPRLRI